ncbi:MAG TPA: ATP-dependent DNA ligase [Candidatus Sulfotelmatobacter sp.]|nr:ATP-dependent DNA ligase [Candidatus Sulfotelmatobacter sp.]
MRKLAETCEAIASTTKKLQKTAIVADYLKSCTTDKAAVSVVFLSGKPFPAWEEATLQVGGALLWRVVEELSGKGADTLKTAYRQHGDLGSVAADVLPRRNAKDLSVMEVSAVFRQTAIARGTAAKTVLVRKLLESATPIEAKYIIKIMTGNLRIGLKESLVEEAIAKAYGCTLAEVQRANMLLGDIGETLRLAAASKLAEAKMRLFHPLGFMLASPLESAEEGLSYFAEAAVEDKYDGIRAQAHISGGEVKFFSRTRDEITESFPELPDALAGMQQGAILDGEIVAWEYPSGTSATAEVVDETFSEEAEEKATELGRARPFSALQQRLGRKKVSGKMLRENPVAFVAFDVLYAGGELLIDRPLRERAMVLDELIQNLKHGGHRGAPGQPDTQGRLTFGNEEGLTAAQVIRAPVFRAASPAELDELFTAAQARGNEGLMIKDLASPYSPGKRGKSWLKMKRELATLDVVVTAVEYGHGRRARVLSDYTFAVWDANKDKLVNIGKAYSGLTDVEIAEMTKWFLDHTIEDQGFRRTVEPKIVLEVVFNNMMESDRHESGYALRFPRIVRLRPDKSANEADTMERAREIFSSQAKDGSLNPRGR